MSPLAGLTEITKITIYKQELPKDSLLSSQKIKGWHSCMEVNLIFRVWSKAIFRDFSMRLASYQRCLARPGISGFTLAPALFLLLKRDFSPSMIFNVILTF
jgi:hypothetical protein